MIPRTAVAVVASVLALSGCMSDQQKLAKAQEAKAQQASADDAQCRSYGAAPGSDLYVNCRMQLDSRRTQADEARRQMAIRMLMNNKQQPAQPYSVQPVPAQVNCTSTTYGQTTNTNCH